MVSTKGTQTDRVRSSRLPSTETAVDYVDEGGR